MVLLTFPTTHDKIPQHVANDSRERFTVSTVVSKSAFSLKTGLKMTPAKGVGVYKAREGSNPSFCAMIYPLRKQGINHINEKNLESYRSGHNGAVLKTVRRQRHRGSNPLLSAIKDCTFVYHDKSAVFSCFRTKSTQNGKKQAKRGFGAVNTAAARPFFHLHGR